MASTQFLLCDSSYPRVLFTVAFSGYISAMEFLITLRDTINISETLHLSSPPQKNYSSMTEQDQQFSRAHLSMLENLQVVSSPAMKETYFIPKCRAGEC